MEKITTLTEVGDFSDYSLPPFPRVLGADLSLGETLRVHETRFEIHSSSGNSTELYITIINDVMPYNDCVVLGTSLTWPFVSSSAKRVFKMDNSPLPAITFHEFII